MAPPIVRIVAALLIVCTPTVQDQVVAQPLAHSESSDKQKTQGGFDLYPPEIDLFIESQGLAPPRDSGGKRVPDEDWLQRLAEWLAKSNQKPSCEISPVLIHMTFSGDFEGAGVSHLIESDPETKDLSSLLNDTKLSIFTFVPTQGKHLIVTNGMLLSVSKDHRCLLNCRRVFELRDDVWHETSFNCESMPALGE